MNIVVIFKFLFILNMILDMIFPNTSRYPHDPPRSIATVNPPPPGVHATGVGPQRDQRT